MARTEQAVLEGTLGELIDIGEIWQQEDKVLDVVSRHLDKAGVRYERQPDGTMIAHIEGERSDEPEIGLCAHVDVAAPHTKGGIIVDGNVIKTDGTRLLGGDDKTAVAAMLCLATYFRRGRFYQRRIKPLRSLKMIFTAGEEAGLHGAAALSPEQVPDNIIAFDWVGGVDQVVEKSPAMRKIDYRTVGLAAHAALHGQGKNAGIPLAMAIAELADKVGDYDPDVIFNIGQAAFGAARNQVPQEGWLQAELRSHDLAAVERAASAVCEQLVEVAGRFDVKSEINLDKQSDPYVLNTQSGLYELATTALGKLGRVPVHTASFGCYDTNIFDAHPGKTGMTMGAAYYNPHTNEEWVDRKQLLELYEYMKVLVSTPTPR